MEKKVGKKKKGRTERRRRYKSGEEEEEEEKGKLHANEKDSKEWVQEIRV